MYIRLRCISYGSFPISPALDRWINQIGSFLSCRDLLSTMTEQPRPSSLSPRTSFTNNGPDNEIIRNKEKEKEISPGLRHRGLWRAATFAAEDAPSHENPRRNSTLSDSVSEARNSIRSSTDDLFLPRVSGPNDADLHDESHWQSSPLGLALLPAIAGVFFQNGGAVVTDITLLILAAIFLNWSVRLPW